MSGNPWTLLLFVVEVALIHTGHTSALAQTAPAAPASKVASAATGRVFASDAGLVLNFIKPDKASDFETVMAKLKEALVKSQKPERKQQAAGWKVFRAIEPGANGSVLYLFTIDPAIKGADYTVANILAEAFPSEVQELYKKYSESYASGQNIVSLNVLMSFGQSVTPVQ
jgi:hypothetical protein